jgi:hypothetical protein
VGAHHNAYGLAADFSERSATAQARADAVTRHHAMLLKVRIQAHASGRPGPNVITGDYRRSWTVTHMGSASTVGTNKPQARRLEWGFYGPDRLGRVYNQRPYPHVGPAVDETAPGYQDALLDIVDDI